MIYQIDYAQKWVNAYDSDLNRVPGSSINLNSLGLSPFSIALYNNGSNQLIYVGFQGGSLKVYDQSTLQLTNPSDTTNFGGNPRDMLISESYEYLMVALPSLIQLWQTDGNTHTNTNKVININGLTRIDYDQNGRLFAVSNANTLMIFS